MEERVNRATRGPTRRRREGSPPAARPIDGVTPVSTAGASQALDSLGGRPGLFVVSLLTSCSTACEGYFLNSAAVDSLRLPTSTPHVRFRPTADTYGPLPAIDLAHSYTSLPITSQLINRSS